MNQIVNNAIIAGIELVTNGSKISKAVNQLRKDEILATLISFHGLRLRISRSIAGDVSQETQSSTLLDYCQKTNTDITAVPFYWDKPDKGISALVKNPDYVAPVDGVDGKPIVDYEEVKRILDAEYTKSPIKYTFTTTATKSNKEGALKWADLHFGAHIRNLVLTRDYDSTILREGLMASVEEVNTRGYRKTHVHILGDLIESFTGRNHKNSYMSFDKDEIGASAVKLCTKLLADALSQITNLGTVKIVGGNHDRISMDNDDDVKGGAADLIAWGLTLMGFDVEFHPYVIVHKVDGINHINFHGDKKLSSRSTADLLWKYGEKGVFNFIFEAHLHSIIENLSTTQRDKFKVIRDDSVTHRRMHLPPFFTGNYYSETLGYSSNSGYVIVHNNGKGVPNTFSGAV